MMWRNSAQVKYHRSELHVHSQHDKNLDDELWPLPDPIGKVNLDKPLNLVIGTVSPTSVLLSWGPYTKTSYEGNIMNDCLADGCVACAYALTDKLLIQGSHLQI